MTRAGLRHLLIRGGVAVITGGGLSADLVRRSCGLALADINAAG